ncbi:MAG: TROVE domain-containing protein [Verrucomicrobiales bacterium]|nr:TROVE domain-containing protein [Verrucomicrobiales bacterium]
MANKNLFRSQRGALLPQTDATNQEGAPAYAFGPRHALAQYVATGCLNSTFYASAKDQLQQLLSLARDVDDPFLAKAAVYARTKGFMKDTPAVLCALLATRDTQLLRRVFDRVIDDGKMLRNFVQVMRSGAVGRKSLGTVPKKLAQGWLESRTDEQLFRASVGNDPSMADLIKLVHPKPNSPQREALYGYLLERKHEATALPEIVKQFEAFKAAVPNQRGVVPEVPFQMLTALNLGQTEWAAIAKQAPWQMTRMNLNTFARHGVFNDRAMVNTVAQRLKDPSAVRRARAFPYQLLAAFRSAGNEVPSPILEALQDAMEVATENVPRLEGKIYVCPDVSGSMSSPVTGHRKGATSSVRCIDVAALVAASILRQNPQAEVLPFESNVVPVRLNARDSIMTNAEKLAAVGGGGTNCSAPLAELNRRQAKGDLVVFISDNESWVDATNGRGTGTMREWTVFKRFNPQAQLVCIDLQPSATTQANEGESVLNVGGFSDQVFEVIAAFTEGRLGAEHWVGVMDAISL